MREILWLAAEETCTSWPDAVVALGGLAVLAIIAWVFFR